MNRRGFFASVIGAATAAIGRGKAAPKPVVSWQKMNAYIDFGFKQSHTAYWASERGIVGLLPAVWEVRQ